MGANRGGRGGQGPAGWATGRPAEGVPRGGGAGRAAETGRHGRGAVAGGSSGDGAGGDSRELPAAEVLRGQGPPTNPIGGTATGGGQDGTDRGEDAAVDTPAKPQTEKGDIERIRKGMANDLSVLYRTIEKHNKRKEKLVIPGVGEFAVHWTLTCDMKTLKLIFGVTSGPNAQFHIVHSMKEKRKGAWVGGARDGKQSMAPNRQQKDPDWDPLLSFDLEDVSLCTLHAHNRMADSLVHNQVCSIWFMPENTPAEKAARSARITAMEEILSSMGVQGGHNELRVDPRDPEANRSEKVSMKDTTARLLIDHRKHNKHGEMVQGKWHDMVKLEPNAARRQKLVSMWRWFEKYVPYLTDLTYSRATGSDPDKHDKVISSFLEAYISAWGDAKVTFYMVSPQPHVTDLSPNLLCILR
jgi:hypothetical protein